MSFVTDFFYNIAYTMLSWLPDLNFQIPAEFQDTFFNLFNSVVYFLPVRLCLPIIIFWLSFQTFKIIWKIILRIKSFIPGMGD